MTPEIFYKSRIEELNKEIARSGKGLAWISLFRFLAILFSVFLVIRGTGSENPLILISAGIALFVIFVALVFFYRSKQNQKRFLSNLLDINKKQLRFLEGDYRQFRNGKEFVDPEHDFTHDLDIFGKDSLFQYINRCCTLQGEQWLAGHLRNAPYTGKTWEQYRQAIQDMETRNLFSQEYLATGRMMEKKEDSQEEILEWISGKIRFKGLALKMAIILVSLANTTAILAGTIKAEYFNLLYLTIPTAWIIYGFHFKNINHYHNLISRKQELISRFNSLNKIYISYEYQSELLSLMKEDLKGLTRLLSQLDKLINLLDSRLNMFVGAVLNSLFLFDLVVIRRLETWKSKHAWNIPILFNHHARIDGLISCGMFCYDHPEFTWPIVSSSTFRLIGAAHPMIPSPDRIPNDLIIDPEERVLLVTGANMAGKSTFLRTVGINMILAGAGLKVCAGQFIFKPLKLITGMRTSDSLSESESYFFAELKRLKRIIDRFENKEELLVLLDEILKGTNSEDKRKGSEALVQRLINYQGIILVATHDISLGDLENQFPRKVSNYHFDSTIVNDELNFDYKIKPGVAKNMNASFLMKKMEIILPEK